MASRSTAAWLMASLLAIACSFHKNGLASNGDEMDGGGGLVGTPGTGGTATGGQGGITIGPRGGMVGSGGVATGGSLGAGGMLVFDAAPAPPPLPPDAAVIVPPPDAAVSPPPPDAAVAPPPPDSAPPQPRDAAPAPVNTIACGAASCVVGQQACCVTAAGASCIPFGGLCLGGSAFRCDGPEDCDNGRVCCLRNENGLRSACARAPECAQGGGAAICRSGADCPQTARTCTPVPNATISVCR